MCQADLDPCSIALSSVIQVENLSKLYRLGEVSTGTISHDINRWWHRVRGKEDPYAKVGQVNDRARGTAGDGLRPDDHYVWALRDINFTVQQGQVLGIIGRNGAGKSTLLKILSRVTAPSSGRIKVKGRIASLLEVGTGFHPELTGRENIFLNGAILGMRRGEIRRKLDEIVDFSGCAAYLDTPVKRYSSGMYVRLAFAVAAHLEPEILVVDEVLAVGDAEFQRRCIGKLRDISRADGRTVLFVSHNMTAVRNLCTQGIVADQGRLAFAGNIEQAVSHYQRHGQDVASDTWQRPATIPRSNGLHFTHATLSAARSADGLELTCDCVVAGSKEARRAFMAMDICEIGGSPLMQALPTVEPVIPGGDGPKRIIMRVCVPPLIPGTYLLDLWLGEYFNLGSDYIRGALSFRVDASPTPDRTFPHDPNHGHIVPSSSLEVIPEGSDIFSR